MVPFEIGRIDPDTRNPCRLRSGNIVFRGISDENRFLRSGVANAQCFGENLRGRFPITNLFRYQNEIEIGFDAEEIDLAALHFAWSVRDKTDSVHSGAISHLLEGFHGISIQLERVEAVVGEPLSSRAHRLLVLNPMPAQQFAEVLTTMRLHSD